MKSRSILAAGCVLAMSAAAFEKIALVDSFDFARQFDVETVTGNVQVLEHVMLTGCDTVLWRNCTGGMMRYASEEESCRRTECPVEKMRVPESRRVFGWLRLDRREPDIFRLAMWAAAERGLKKGVHWPFEEAHWAHFTLGQWNVMHPQYWCVEKNGTPFGWRASLAYPEVVEHKLRLVDELVERGADTIFIDTFRNGGWTPAIEYVEPMKRAWAEKHPGEGLPDYRDPRWSSLAMEFQHAYLRKMRAKLDRAGRKVRLILGISHVGRPYERDYNVVERGMDWRRLAAEGTIDGIIVMCVASETLNMADPWEATRKVYREIVEHKGSCSVFFPVSVYNYSGTGMPAYAQKTGLPLAEVARRLMRLAANCGGDGISMECVDYGNYSPDVCAAIRDFSPDSGEPDTDDYIHGAPKKQARAEILWTRAICKEAGRYIGWPTICRRKNGELLAVFSGDRQYHVCPWGKVQMVRSTDNGETWSAPETICNTVNDDRDAGIMEMQNGDLLVTWFSSLCYAGNYPANGKLAKPDSERFVWQRHFEKLPRDLVKTQLGYFTRRSTDGGKTWEPPVRTTGSANHGGIQLKDGQLLMVGRRWNNAGNFLPEDAARQNIRHELTVEESKDFGRSWRQIASIKPPEDISQFHEPHLVEAADGTIVAQFRCHIDYNLRQCESTDGGKTWTEVRRLPIHGHPPHLIRLVDNKLLTVYCVRDGAYGEYACISDDNGKTWDVKNQIKLAGHWSGHWVGDFGYPASAQLPDGSIITIYYAPEHRGEPPCLMATKWRLK